MKEIDRLIEKYENAKKGHKEAQAKIPLNQVLLHEIYNQNIHLLDHMVKDLEYLKNVLQLNS